MYLVFSSEEAARSRERELSAALGYPCSKSGTTRYAEPFKHPSAGSWALLICDIWNPQRGAVVSAFSHITAQERASLSSAEELREGGWFRSEDLAGG